MVAGSPALRYWLNRFAVHCYAAKDRFSVDESYILSLTTQLLLFDIDEHLPQKATAGHPGIWPSGAILCTATNNRPSRIRDANSRLQLLVYLEGWSGIKDMGSQPLNAHKPPHVFVWNRGGPIMGWILLPRSAVRGILMVQFNT